MDKDFKKLLNEARRQGWRVDEGKTHVKLWPPNPAFGVVIVAATPSDHRAFQNTVARMRRAGFQWPPPKKKRKP